MKTLPPLPTARDILEPEELPRVDHLVTEDDTPVDNLLSEKQMRLLVDQLTHSWSGPGDGRSFVTMTNVGLFSTPHSPPLVPDFLLSLDVQLAAEWWAHKETRSYFIWEFGKPPDAVIEIVSNREGGEGNSKLQAYARLGIPYYVIYDPYELLGGGSLRLYSLHVGKYQLEPEPWLANVGLGLTIWSGKYEGAEAPCWLRWRDRQGAILPTGQERIEQEKLRAEQEKLRAEQEKLRAERLVEQLRKLGVDPVE